MMEPFDVAELPERITEYRNSSLSQALARNAQYLQQMWQGVSEDDYVALWQDLAQDAVNAMGTYMEPRVDSLMDGDDPRLVFYEDDGTEPIYSYVLAWVEGYATRALGGRCSEGEVRPMIERQGISLYQMENRVAYAETVLPQRGYGEECVSVAIGHAILSYVIVGSGSLPDDERVRFNWMGDIDGFASGWRRAQADGLGEDTGYVPYSEDDQLDAFVAEVGSGRAAGGQEDEDRNGRDAYNSYDDDYDDSYDDEEAYDAAGGHGEPDDGRDEDGDADDTYISVADDDDDRYGFYDDDGDEDRGDIFAGYEQEPQSTPESSPESMPMPVPSHAPTPQQPQQTQRQAQSPVRPDVPQDCPAPEPVPTPKPESAPMPATAPVPDDEEDFISDVKAMTGSLPQIYSSVLDAAEETPVPSATAGIFIEVGSAENPIVLGAAPSHASAQDSAVFTPEDFEDIDDFEDVSEEDVLRIKTKVEEGSEASITGAFMSVVSDADANAADDGGDEDAPEIVERTVRRLPPVFEKYLMLSVSSAMRGNASRLAELTDAGMTMEQSDRLRRKLTAATARYGMKELAIAGMEDGIPADEDGTEPVRTYAGSWLQGYVAVITDGEASQDAFVRAALMSIVSPADIERDIEHIVERQAWEGYDDECMTATVAYLRVTMSRHGSGHPLAHAMEGSPKFSARGATDGFSDGWWKATEIVRRMEESGVEDELPLPVSAAAEPEPHSDPQTTTDMEKAKEEAKSLLAGLFLDDAILPEASVSELIGTPMPVANQEKVERVRREEAEDRARRGQDAAFPTPVPAGEEDVSPQPQQQPAQRPNQSPQGQQPTPQQPQQPQVALRQPQQPQQQPTQQQVPQQTPQPPSQPQQQPARQQAEAPEQPKQSKQERVRRHADQCARLAVRQNADLVKQLWQQTGMDKDAASRWTRAVTQATATYGWYVVSELGANPKSSRDGTRPMQSYAVGWILGYASAYGWRETSERAMEQAAQAGGISLGETGERITYARDSCSAHGYVQECSLATIMHVKWNFITHDGRSPMPVPEDTETFNWIADADGFADGWTISKRVQGISQ